MTATGSRGFVPLPSPEEVRSEVQQMVDLGHRLTGGAGHERFCSWLGRELSAAGLELLPCDEYRYRRWNARRLGLELLGGPLGTEIVHTVDVATAYVRSASTPPEGVVGPLVDLGAIPIGDPFAALGSGTSSRPVSPEVEPWMAQLPREELAGSVVLVDLAVPLPLSAEGLVMLADYLHWPGHDLDDWKAIDYRRLWIGPWPELDLFEQLGVAGVVFVVDAGRDQVAGNYSPHVGRPQPVPALVLDRDAGRVLRARLGDAGARPRARLILDAPSVEVAIRTVTAVLPGASDEVVVVNSHSDGQNAFEENGSVALVALARHFASLPPTQRPARTLVFTSWPGHMSGEEGIEDASCFIAAHPDLCERAVAAVTVEHVGATEWLESADGYQATGENELYAIWATEGAPAEIARRVLQQSDLARHCVLKPPIQITPGAAFHDSGIPHVSGISGPTYLLVVSDDGEMGKFDAGLAARQIRYFAAVISELDAAPREELRAGDPTLGARPRTYRDRS